MIKFLLKLNRCLLVPALFAGVIFFACAFSFTVPKGVTVNGVEVGGLSYAQAAAAVRAQAEDYLKDKRLKIVTDNGEYSFSYPEIYYKDNVYKLLKNAKKGEYLTAEFTYYLCGGEAIARSICANESVLPVEPSAKFNLSGTPFTYDEGRDGRQVDKSALIADINASLNGGFKPVTLKFSTVKRQKSLNEIKLGTHRLAAFTTYFDGGNLTRVSNIRLAASKINGTVLGGGKTFSFNDIVGERLKSRGFLPAKIIENGEFVEGVGGGVCQVSTTLYNAALLAGLDIKEYHPHSLAVSYVPPSRDAMVSGTSCDLKIVNGSDCPVYIRAITGKNYVSFEIYGTETGAYYSLSSQVTGTIKADEEVCDDPAKARDGKDGVTSEGYLTVTRGNYKKTVRLRKDKYLPVKTVRYEAPETPEQEADGENEKEGVQENAGV